MCSRLVQSQLFVQILKRINYIDSPCLLIIAYKHVNVCFVLSGKCVYISESFVMMYMLRTSNLKLADKSLPYYN